MIVKACSSEVPQNYRILRKIEASSSEEVGQPVAINFDFGLLETALDGEVKLSGTVLCFTPFRDDSNSSKKQKGSSFFAEMAASILEDFQFIGLTCVDLEHFTGLQKSYSSQNAAEIYSILYADLAMEETKLAFLVSIALAQIETIFENNHTYEDHVKPILELFKAVLQGRITHLDQIELPGNLKSCAGILMLTRREALKSKSPEGWTFLEQDFQRFLQRTYGVDKKSQQVTTLKEFLQMGPFTSPVGVLLEADWIVRGIRISDSVRNSPDFDRFKSLIRRHGTLVEDISRLKNANGVQTCISVEILAQILPLQSAIQESLEILESTFFKTKEAARALLRAFPNDKTVQSIVESAGLWADSILPIQQNLPNQNGKITNSKLSKVVVEFDEGFRRKETELEAFLKNSVQAPSENIIETSELFAAISKIFNQKSDRNGNNKEIISLEKNSKISPDLVETTPAVPINIATRVPTAECPLKHLGLIPDGNRRWARGQGQPTWKGHEAGRAKVIEVAKAAFERGVHTITIWALSPENFSRNSAELEKLWWLMEEGISTVTKLCDEFQSRFRHIGEKQRIPERLRKIIEDEEKRTESRTAHCVNLAIDYSGREEVVAALSKIRSPISAKVISDHLWSADQLYPEPDLIVRTGFKDSSTYRMSGFMTWQSVYSELLFIDKYMPDVTKEDVNNWVEDFSKSERRFGK